MVSPESLSASLSTFALISLAEIGDKSQLVCMTLAARHRHWPVILGAAAAFTVLNALAVIFGAGVAAWVPERVTAGVVAVLFGAFGIHALRTQDDAETEDVIERPGHSIFFTTLLLILVAEFGDKTQIAVAGLAGGKSVTKARKELRESLITTAPVFAAKPFFMSDTLTLVDCSIAPLLWRLPILGIELPAQAKAVQEYAANLFERESFQSSLTELEREMRE